MYTGLTAKLTVDENRVAYISNWSVDETRDTVEVTELGAHTKKVLPSLLYWSASAEGAIDFSDKTTDEKNQPITTHKAIRDKMVRGESVTVDFYLDENTYLHGEALVGSFSVNVSAEDKASVSVSLTGIGGLKLVNVGETAKSQNI